MTNTQLTLVQIDNYGPWTVTPSPRREMDLQTLQSRLFADIAQFVGSRDGYAFFTRFDNMVAVTNGLDGDDHALLQETIGNRYPVSVSLGIGTDATPAAALDAATAGLQHAGSAQDGNRREVLVGDPVAERDDEDVWIAHFDVVDATEKYTDRLNAFDTFIEIEQGYAALMRHLRREHGGLAFFVGGDNVIGVVPEIDDRAFRDVIAHVEDAAGVELQVGVGHGRAAADAGMRAKHALERCRHHDTAVEVGERLGAGPGAGDD
ncbi:MAG: GTP cyclohydrolase III [Haloferacaceae archaeon]